MSKQLGLIAILSVSIGLSGSLSGSLAMGEPVKGKAVISPAQGMIDEVKERARSAQIGCNEQADLDVSKISRKFRYSYETPNDPEREANFYIASCPSGAYNTASVIFRDDPYNGLVIVALASPLFSETTLKVIGWISQTVVGSISYDAKNNELVSFSKGRGIGDMSVSATYSFLEDSLVLRRYEFDGSADGKFNPKVVYESLEPLVR